MRPQPLPGVVDQGIDVLREEITLDLGPVDRDWCDLRGTIGGRLGSGHSAAGPGGSLDVGLLQRGDRTAEGAARGAQFGENVDRPRDRFGAQHE